MYPELASEKRSVFRGLNQQAVGKFNRIELEAQGGRNKFEGGDVQSYTWQTYPEKPQVA